MAQTDRRKFLQSLTAGVAGLSLYPTFGANLTLNLKENNQQFINLKDDASEAFWEKVKNQFRFAAGVRYFNNASLGSSAIPIRKATNEFRDILDDFPSKYMWGGWTDEKEKTRLAVADYFSVDKEEIAITHNTTEGMNLIAKSFDFQKGDEVLISNHDHTSARIPWEVWQVEKGIKLTKVSVPNLPKSKEAIVDLYRKAITPKTKVISLCHIVNTNGMIFPIKEISEIAHKKGILVAVDGAQSAGMFNIDLHELGCDFYTASSHKWLFSPKGVGVFYARKESQKHLKPLIVCRGHKDTSIRRLENYNTRNLPEFLGLGASIDFLNSIGKQKIHDRSFELKNYFRSKLENNDKVRFKTPKSDDLSAAIQVVEVVGKDVRQVKKELFDTYGIDCRPMSGLYLNALRFSFAIYITKKDIDDLVAALHTIAS
ncbi:MAG: aminotransferase [Flavobacteriaceae bacterium]|nr:aminotransferase [Flavobacteriaceae bacterium]|tara:strand:- start:381396 stop:382679 length:1284 start_codon:yes stop_codon:yes gene_type:complete